jgi:hypothetical protein
LTPIKDKGKGIEGADSVHGEGSVGFWLFNMVWKISSQRIGSI